MRSSRSPHGERGLKYVTKLDREMASRRRSPHGERGLKSARERHPLGRQGRSPHGERGLKSYFAITRDDNKLSLSSWRAWIEISCVSRASMPSIVALLMESVD